MYNQQVLIDREDAAGFKRLGDLSVNLQACDRKLLLGIFVLFHKDHVLNRLIAHLKSLVPRQHNPDDQSDELLQRAIQEHKYECSDGVSRVENTNKALQLVIVQDRDYAEQEEYIVAEAEEKHITLD